jgi:hypothetical protein
MILRTVKRPYIYLCSWEVSAVIAMRNMQWLFAPTGHLPSAGINDDRAWATSGHAALNFNEAKRVAEMKLSKNCFARTGIKLKIAINFRCPMRGQQSAALQDKMR